MSRIVAALLFCVVASSASAQVFYEPVRYQYGAQRPFYYGGTDPEMFRAAHRDRAAYVNDFAFANGDVTSHREVSDLAPRVYVDRFPRGNSAIYGYTPNDARNAAYQNVPTYFRMRDQFAHATRDADGAIHVPAQVTPLSGGTIEIKPYVRPKQVTMPRPVIVIPKSLLEKPAKTTPAAQIADTR